MGIVTALVGLALVVIGLGSLIRRRSLLPELDPPLAALATVPFGLIILVLGLAIGLPG